MRKSIDIIQVALILSAIDTALQAFAPFRRIGAGLPIVMGVSFAFLPALQAMGASGFSFGALLGGEIVGGAVAVVFGLGIWMASGCLAGEGMPTWVSTVIGSNAVTPTVIMAIVLNLILPQTPVVAQHIDAAKDAAVDLVLPESKK